jgi:pleckstrin family protein A (phosphoinositide binding specific) protein 8
VTYLLYRAMEFVQHFIAEVSAGEHSLDVAAGKAYSCSLRRFHGWIVRGVFNVSTMQWGSGEGQMLTS